MKAHEFDRVIRKFDMRTRPGKHLLAWFEYGGQVITRTRRSKGSGDLPVCLIRKQLALDDDQLRCAIDCTIGRDDYIEILRERGLI